MNEAQPVQNQQSPIYIDLDFFSYDWTFFAVVFISGFASTAVAIISIRSKLYKRPLSAMILGINLADIIFYYSKLSVFIWKPQSTLHCNTLGVLFVLGLDSSVIWGAFFAYAFYIIMKNQDANIVASKMKYFILISIIWPSINATSSIFTKFLEYDEVQETCVHRVEEHDPDLDYLFFINFPISLSCISSIVWYKLALNRIRAILVVESKTEHYVLLVYPGILVLCWAPFLAVQILIMCGVVPSIVFCEIAILLVHLQGFLDAIVYGQSGREILMRGLKKWCCRCKFFRSQKMNSEVAIVPMGTVELEQSGLPKSYGIDVSIHTQSDALFTDYDSRRPSI